MAFDSLTEKLQNVFKNLRSKGRLTEEDVKTALKEVKMALLEADVNFKVVKNFIKTVQERAVGQDVMNSLTPGQMVVKLVNEELVNLMGSETTEIKLKPSSEISVVLMCGLQGAGKTTTTAKIAGKLKSKGRRPLLVACDIYRPAAIEQLQVNGNKQGVEVFSMGKGHKPVDIAKAAIEHASKNNFNVVILDTAGRLHIDEDMMAELMEIKDNVSIDQSLLVVDAMTGQDAVNVATVFNDKIGIDGVILTKLDGDTRGGDREVHFGIFVYHLKCAFLYHGRRIFREHRLINNCHDTGMVETRVVNKYTIQPECMITDFGYSPALIPDQHHS